MKKITTCIFALLLTAGVAFGQNSATTSQTGNDNTATVDQTANNGGNEATITQHNNDGQAQNASITQVYEAGNGITANNVASITQSGSNNTSGSGNNTVELSQFGAGNTYTVSQTGNGNEINDLADQGDRPDEPSFSATIEMTQDGDNNIINDADQVGHGNTFIIDQLGNNNKADMEAQVNTGAAADGNYMKITQNGNGNNAGFKKGLYQEGQNNSLTLTQNGGALFGNQNVEVSPGGMPPSTGPENFGGSSAVTQLGDDNTITATQGPGNNVVESILQQGYNNTITIDQGAGAHSATLSQVGNDNTATITQN